MVLAMVGLCRASGISWNDTIQLANTAAGLEVERLGAACISRKEIEAELLSAASSTAGKIVSAEEMAVLAEGYRRSSRKVVFTNGCFDLLHAGHVQYLGCDHRFGHFEAPNLQRRMIGAGIGTTKQLV